MSHYKVLDEVAAAIDLTPSFLLHCNSGGSLAVPLHNLSNDGLLTIARDLPGNPHEVRRRDTNWDPRYLICLAPRGF